MLRAMIRSVLLLLVVGAFAGCGSKDKGAPAKPAEPAAQPAAADLKGLCVKFMTRSRECTSNFIPALVDLRARHDMPPGIAAKVKENRDAVIAEAMKEWETDSKDENITAMCDRMGDDETAKQHADEANGCLAKTACPDFVGCAMPIHEAHFANGPSK
jgi:hypothetical protein